MAFLSNTSHRTPHSNVNRARCNGVCSAPEALNSLLNKTTSSTGTTSPAGKRASLINLPNAATLRPLFTRPSVK